MLEGLLFLDSASNDFDVVEGMTALKKRPTERGEMLATIPCFWASSANSLAVQWVIGRENCCGSSQAMATICTIASGLKVGGLPNL